MWIRRQTVYILLQIPSCPWMLSLIQFRRVLYFKRSCESIVYCWGCLRQSGLADSNVQNHERPIFEKGWKRDITKMLDVALDSCLQYLAILQLRAIVQDAQVGHKTWCHLVLQQATNFSGVLRLASPNPLEQSACPSAPARPVRPTRCVCLKPANHIRSIGHIGICCTRLNEMLPLASWQQWLWIQLKYVEMIQIASTTSEM